MSSFILDIQTNTKPGNKNGNTFSLEYKTSAKFHHDKVNFENDDFYLLLDGIVLNKKKLLEKSIQTNWAEYLIESYQKQGTQFFKHLKGSYYGFLFDKTENKWIVFTDHISSKPMYYAEYNNHIVFSNNYTGLVNHLKKNGKKVTLNEQGAYLLLSYGYVFEDITITNEIKRLMVGYCALVQNNKLNFEKFYTLTNNPVEISENEAIEQIDKRFRDAVQLAFEKDKEYGYKHVASLSGGLDSRMTVWVAHDLGYTNQLNLTFSQSNYLDETIPKQIAADLKHEWLFKALDNGNFLKNIDETTQITGGNVLYYGLAHGLSLYNYLNFEKLGILHSGQLGDVVISTFYSTLNKDKQFNFGDGAYSKKLLSAIKSFSFKENYPNEEIYKMYIRGFYGANQGLMGSQEFTETYSPFYDIDFMEFALSIPLKLRFNHYIYKKWLNKKYPKAANYIWEKDKVPVNYPYWINIKGRKIPLNQLVSKLASRIGIARYGINTKRHMNPLEYWYNNNNDLKLFIEKYFNENITLLENYTELKKDCEKLFLYGKGPEINQVISLMGAIKNIF
ncbi:MAG: asparagine synthase [Spirochaetes bacterium]|nr:asparagine synthase [Spirochaetota bacterium]